MDRSALITQFPERVVQMSKRKSTNKSLLASYKKKKRKTKKKGLSQKLHFRSENVSTVFDLNGRRRKMFPHHLPITVVPSSNGDSSVVMRMLSTPTYSWGSGRRGCHRNCKTQIQLVKRKRGRPKKCQVMDARVQSLSPCVSGLSNNVEECEELTPVLRRLSLAEDELMGNFIYNARRPKSHSHCEAVGKIAPNNGTLRLSVRLAKVESAGEGSENVSLERTSLQNSHEGQWRCFNMPLVSQDVVIENMSKSEDLVSEGESQRGQTKKRRRIAFNFFESSSTGETDKRKQCKGDESQISSDLPNKVTAAFESKNHLCNTESFVAVPLVAALSDVPTSKSNGHLLFVKKEQNSGDRTVVDLCYRKCLEEHPVCSMDCVPQSEETPIGSTLSPLTVKIDSSCGKVKLVLSKNLCSKKSKKHVEKQQPQTVEDWYCQEVNFTGIRLKRENRKSSEGETDFESVRKPKKLKRSSSLLKNTKKCRPCSVILVDFVKCLNLGASSNSLGHHFLASVCCSPDWQCTPKGIDAMSITHLENIDPISPIRISTLPWKTPRDSCLEVIGLTSAQRGDVGNQRDMPLTSIPYLSSSDPNFGLTSVKMNYFPARFSAELIPSTEERGQQETDSFGLSENMEPPALFVGHDDGLNLNQHMKVCVYERSPNKAANETKGKTGSNMQVKLQFPKLKKIFDSVVKASKSSAASASGVDGAWIEQDGGCTRITVDGHASSCKDSSATQEVAFQPSTSEEGIDSMITVSSGGSSPPPVSEDKTAHEFALRMKRSKPELGAALHTCAHCIFSTPNRVSMREHIYIHTDIIPFMCGLCGALFGTQSAASLHSKRDHPGKDRQIIKDSTINAEDHYMTEYAAKVADCRDSAVDAEESKLNVCTISKALSCHDSDVKNLVAVESLALEASESDVKNFSFKNCSESVRTMESVEVGHVFKDLTKGKNPKDCAPLSHNGCKMNSANNTQRRGQNSAVDINDFRDVVYQDLVLQDCAEKSTLENTNPEIPRLNCSSATGSTARNPAARRPGPRCRIRKDLASSERSAASGGLHLDTSAQSQDHRVCKRACDSEQSLVDDGSHSELPSSTSSPSVPLSSVGEISVVTCRTALDASELNKHLLSPKSATLDNEKHRCSDSSKRYSCIHCDYSTSEIADVENHVFVMHPRTKRLMCPICKCYFCKWKPTMLSHFSLRHPKVKPVLLYEPSYLQKEDVDLTENKHGKNSVMVLRSLKSQKKSPKRMQVQKLQSVNSTTSLRRSGRLSVTFKVSDSSRLVAKPSVSVFEPLLGVNSIENQLKVLHMQPTQQTSGLADENVNSDPDMLEDLNVVVKTCKDEPVENGCTSVNAKKTIGNSCIKTDPDVLQLQQPLPVFIKSEEPPSESRALPSCSRVIGSVCFYETGKSSKQRNCIPYYFPEENPTLDLDSIVSTKNSGTGKDFPTAQESENGSREAVEDIPFDTIGTSNRKMTESILLCDAKPHQVSPSAAFNESSSSSCMAASGQSCGKIVDPCEKVSADTASGSNESEKKLAEVYAHNSAVNSSVVDAENVAQETADFKDVDHSEVISGSVSREPGNSLCPKTDFFAILNEESECRVTDSGENVSSRQMDCQEFSVRPAAVDKSDDIPDCVLAIGCGGIFEEIPVDIDDVEKPVLYSNLTGISSSVSDVTDWVDFFETKEKTLNRDESKSMGEGDKDTFCRTIGEVTECENDDKCSVESVKVTYMALVNETDACDDLASTRRSVEAVACIRDSTGERNVEEGNRSSEVNKIEPDCAAKDSVSITKSETDFTATQTVNSAFENRPEEQNSESSSVSQNLIASLSAENASKTLYDKDSHEIGETLADADGKCVFDDNRADEDDVVRAEDEVATSNLRDACEASEIRGSKEGTTVLGTVIEDLLVKNAIKTFEATEVCDDQESDRFEFEKNEELQSVCCSVIQNPAKPLTAFSSDSMWPVSCLSDEINSLTGTMEKAAGFSCHLETSGISVPATDVTTANETYFGRSACSTHGNKKLLTDVLPKDGQSTDGIHKNAVDLDAVTENGEVSFLAEQPDVSYENLDVSDRVADTDEAMDSKEALDCVIASECDDGAVNTEVVDFEKGSDSIMASQCDDEALNSVAVDTEKASESISICDDRALVCLAADLEKAPYGIIASACDVEARNSVAGDTEEASDSITASVRNGEATVHVAADLEKASDSIAACECGDRAINSVALDPGKASDSIAARSWDDEAVAVGTEKVMDSVTASVCEGETLTSVAADLEKASDNILAVAPDNGAVVSSVAVDAQKSSDDMALSKTFPQLVNEFQFDHTVHSEQSSGVFPASASSACTSGPPDALEQDPSSVATHQGNYSTENEHDCELSELVVDEQSCVAKQQNVQEDLPASFDFVQCREALNSVQDSERSFQGVAFAAAVPTVLTRGQAVREFSSDSAAYNKVSDSVKDSGETSRMLTSSATEPALISGGLNVQQRSSAISDSTQCTEACSSGQDSGRSSQVVSAPAAAPTVLAEPESTSSTTSQDPSDENRVCTLLSHNRTEETVSISVRSEDCMCLEVSSTSDDHAVALPEVPMLEVMPTNEDAVPASDLATDEELDVETYTEEEPERTGVDKQLEEPCGQKETTPTEAECQYCSFNCGDKEKMMQHLQQVHKVEFENNTERKQHSTVEGTDKQLKETEATDEGDDVRIVNVIVIEPNNNFDRVDRKRRRSLSTDDSDSLQPEPMKRPCGVAVAEDESDDVIFVREERRPVGVMHSSRSDKRLTSPASNSIRPSDARLTRPSAALPHSRFIMNQDDAIVDTDSAARRHSGYMASEEDMRRVCGQNIVQREDLGRHRSSLAGTNCGVPAANALHQLRDCLDPFLTECDANVNRSLHATKSSQRTSNPVNFAFVTRAICRPIMSTTLDPIPSQLQVGGAASSSLVGRQMQHPTAGSKYYGHANSRAGPVSVVMATDAGSHNPHHSLAAGVAGPPPLMHISELQMQGNLRTDAQFYPGAIVQNPADHTSRNPPVGNRLADNRADFGMRQLGDNWSNFPAGQLAHNHGDVVRTPPDVRAEFTRPLPDNRGDFARPSVDMQRDFTRPPVDMQRDFARPHVDVRGDYTAKPLAHSRSHFTRPLVDNRADHVTKQLADNRGDFATRPLVDDHVDHVRRQLADDREDFATGRSMVPPPAHSKLPVGQLPMHRPSFPPSNVQARPAVPNVDNLRNPYEMYSTSSTHPHPYSAHLQSSYSGVIFQGTMRSGQPLPAHIPQRSQGHLPPNIPHAHRYQRPCHGPFQLPHTRHLEAAASSTNSCLLCSFQAPDRWSLYNHILTHSSNDHGN